MGISPFCAACHIECIVDCSQTKHVIMSLWLINLSLSIYLSIYLSLSFSVCMGFQ